MTSSYKAIATFEVAQGAPKLHLGCGPVTPQAWINLDGSWNARLAKHPQMLRILVGLSILPKDVNRRWPRDVLVHDVTKGIPFANDSLSSIYASHLLEHLYFEDAKHLLKECFRTLKPSGVLRVVVPDLRAIVHEYVRSSRRNQLPRIRRTECESPADTLNARLLLRRPAQPTGGFLRQIYDAFKDFHTHKWMYDAESLALRFREAGFVQVEEMGFLQSRIEDIGAVEQASRVLDGAGICIEGVKPQLLASPLIKSKRTG